MENSIPKRPQFEGINYIKSFACVSVLLVHFRLNLEMSIPAKFFDLKSAIFMAVDYQLFVICVPLFFMCTGYLMLNKRFSYDYYIKLGKILLLYIVCSLMSYGILALIDGRVFSIKQIIHLMMNYQLIEYAWYVKTYALIYLFFPFVNMFIRLFNKENKWIFEVILLMIIVLIGLPPLLINVGQLPFNVPMKAIYQLYPIMYYLIGAYFRKFGRTYKMGALITLEGFTILLAVGWNIVKRSPYTGTAEGYYPSIVLVIQAALLFLIINQFFNQLNKPNKVITAISKRTLSIYLLSFCIDQLVYPFLLHHAPSAKFLLPFIILIVGFNFTLSFGLAFIAEHITNFVWPKIYWLLKLPEKLFTMRSKKIA